MMKLLAFILLVVSSFASDGLREHPSTVKFVVKPVVTPDSKKENKKIINQGDAVVLSLRELTKKEKEKYPKARAGYDLAMDDFQPPYLQNPIVDHGLSITNIVVTNATDYDAPSKPLDLDFYTTTGTYLTTYRWNLPAIPAWKRLNASLTNSQNVPFDGPLKYGVSYKHYFWVNYDGCSEEANGCSNNSRGPLLCSVYTAQNLEFGKMGIDSVVPAREDLVFDVNIINEGTSTAQPGKFTIKILRNTPFNELSGTFEFGPILPGYQYTHRLVLSGSWMLPSQYLVRVDGQTNTSDEIDSIISFTFTAEGTTINDLEAFDIIPEGELIAGRESRLTFVTKAHLMAKSREKITNTFFYGDELTSVEYSFDSSEIEASGEHRYSAILPAGAFSPGKHKILFKTDIFDAVPDETNTKNNSLEKEFEWRHQVSDVEISRIVLSQGNPALMDDEAYLVDTKKPLDIEVVLDARIAGKLLQNDNSLVLDLVLTLGAEEYPITSWLVSLDDFTTVGVKAEKSWFQHLKEYFWNDKPGGQGNIEARVRPVGSTPITPKKKSRAIRTGDFYVDGWESCQEKSGFSGRDDIRIELYKGRFAEVLDCDFTLVNKGGEPVTDVPVTVEVLEYFEHLLGPDEPESYAERRRYYFDPHLDPFISYGNTDKFMAPIEKVTVNAVNADGKFQVTFRSFSWYVPLLDRTDMSIRNGSGNRDAQHAGSSRTLSVGFKNVMGKYRPPPGRILFSFPMLHYSGREEEKIPSMKIRQWSADNRWGYEQYRWFSASITAMIRDVRAYAPPSSDITGQAFKYTFDHLCFPMAGDQCPDTLNQQKIANFHGGYGIIWEPVDSQNAEIWDPNDPNTPVLVTFAGRTNFRGAVSDLFIDVFNRSRRLNDTGSAPDYPPGDNVIPSGTSHDQFATLIHESRHAFQQYLSRHDGGRCDPDRDKLVLRDCLLSIPGGVPTGEYNATDWLTVGQGFLVDDDKNLFQPFSQENDGFYWGEGGSPLGPDPANTMGTELDAYLFHFFFDEKFKNGLVGGKK